jgi:hypothetical protein
MIFPTDMTEDDIMEFQYEYDRIRDIEQGIGLWEINSELQIIADQMRQETLELLHF